MDRVSPNRRSEIMRRIHSKDTSIEMRVRKYIYSLGFRYRLHVKDLPGKPDIVFRKTKKIVFVHGCFWHGHGCRKGQLPKTNIEFWGDKIRANVDRDSRVIRDLESAGWHVLVIWQCQIGDLSMLQSEIKKFLL
ncbi:very short patch repair endonuclease [Burkholderia sp. BCC0405]|uniref:very short patch repair endonuclease n=1 Tax=Burkholderia sp. BCC0405 TaxID=2676298 RepID=UPI00158D8E93|nr:very short patch repair endonuclease [Burkholderia sp. BCC0405]